MKFQCLMIAACLPFAQTANANPIINQDHILTLLTSVPVRICVLENSPISQLNRLPNEMVHNSSIRPIISAVNDIWSQANITFSTNGVSAFPIVEEMNYNTSDNGTLKAIPGGGSSVGAYLTAKECIERWEDIYPLNNGIVVLFVKTFRGSPTSVLLKGIASNITAQEINYVTQTHNLFRQIYWNQVQEREKFFTLRL